MAGDRLSGVYCIRHVPSGARYVGSSKNIADRLRGHLKALSRGTHTAAKMLVFWQRDGAGSFVFEILEPCDPSVLRDREQAWIDDVSDAMLLNVGRLAKYSSVVPEVAAKIAARLRGQKHSEERKANISASRIGKKLGPQSEIHRDRIRQKSLLHRHSANTLDQIRAHHWSRSPNAESIRAVIATKARSRMPSERLKASWADPDVRCRKAEAAKSGWERRRQAEKGEHV